MMKVLLTRQEGQPRPRRELPREDVVYFLRCAGAIKIGTTNHLHRRICEINTSLPEDGELLGTLPGGRSVERRVHRILTAFHKRGEWYSDCPEVREAIIGYLRNGGLPELSAVVKAIGAAAVVTDEMRSFDKEFEVVKAVADRLSALSRDELLEAAKTAGLKPNMLGRAAIRSAISAGNLIRICGAIGLDPMTLEPCECQALGEFSLGLFALGLNIRRRLRKHSLRKVAAAAGLKHLSVHRAEGREPVAIKATLAICKYIGVHPFKYCADPNASRETAETSQIAAEQESAA